MGLGSKNTTNKMAANFHIVSESFPNKTLQISVEKEGLALLYINKAQTKSPTHHRRILYVRRIKGGQRIQILLNVSR